MYTKGKAFEDAIKHFELTSADDLVIKSKNYSTINGDEKIFYLSQKIIEYLEQCNDEIDKEKNILIEYKSNVFKTEKKLRDVLSKLIDIQDSLKNIQIDIIDFNKKCNGNLYRSTLISLQTVKLSLDIIIGNFEVTIALNHRIIESQKSNRTVLTNILISVVAVVIAGVSLIFSLN